MWQLVHQPLPSTQPSDARPLCHSSCCWITERGICVRLTGTTKSQGTWVHLDGVQHSWASTVASMENSLDTQRGSWSQPLAKHCHLERLNHKSSRSTQRSSANNVLCTGVARTSRSCLSSPLVADVFWVEIGRWNCGLWSMTSARHPQPPAIPPLPGQSAIHQGTMLLTIQ